jgi:hypothetical protein
MLPPEKYCTTYILHLIHIAKIFYRFREITQKIFLRYVYARTEVKDQNCYAVHIFPSLFCVPLLYRDFVIVLFLVQVFLHNSRYFVVHTLILNQTMKSDEGTKIIQTK